jgi:hypothetical protein
MKPEPSGTAAGEAQHHRNPKPIIGKDGILFDSPKPAYPWMSRSTNVFIIERAREFTLPVYKELRIFTILTSIAIAFQTKFLIAVFFYAFIISIDKIAIIAFSALSSFFKAFFAVAAMTFYTMTISAIYLRV